MIKVAVTGACGRMGSNIIHAVIKQEDMKLTAAVEFPQHKNIGQDIGEVLGLGKINVSISDSLEKVIKNADVVIEFVNPKVSLRHMEIASSQRIPIVIGTTGFNESEIEEIDKLSKNMSCVLSPNMSIGVNVLFYLSPKVAEILGDDYNIEIIEAHHNLKKDAPSGTAAKLAQVIADGLNRDLSKCGVYGRKGLVGERKKEEIGVHAVRGGDIVGDHTLLFAGQGERIEITHRAHTREVFVFGAIKAARFVVSAKPGLYNMQDVLGISKEVQNARKL